MKQKILCLFILLSSLQVAWAQGSSVKGKVTDSTGEDVIGVSVFIKGTSIGTITDLNGFYSLNVPDRQSVLTFSYLGYISQEVTVGNRSEINVVMEEDIQRLGDIVVVGYGSTKKIDLTGSITTLQADNLSYMATTNVGQALQGKVSGMQVTNSGAPGSSPVIRIRGLASVRSNSDPLYVVDGVLTNDISFLGNNDIESISVLKDASASAIYGIKAANGVVIVSTKRGSKDRTRVSVSGYFGIQKITNMFEMANGSQYTELLNEKGAINAARTGGSYTPIQQSAYPHSTDWYDTLLRETGYTQNYDVSVSGGSEKSQYSFGTSYIHQEGMVKGNEYDRINVRAALETQALKFLKIGYNANLSSANTDAFANVLHSAYIAPPNLPIMDENGNYTSMQAFGDFPNPAAQLKYYNRKDNLIRLLGNIYAEINVTKDLTFKTSYGIDGRYKRDREYKPWHYISSAQRDTTRTLIRQTDYLMDSYWDNTLTYQKTISDQHRLTVMAGSSTQETNTQMLRASRLNVPDIGDNTLYLKLGDDQGQMAEDNGSRITALSYFGRVNYAFRDRYLFTGTIRRDGSSLFPENNRWDTFSSIGLGWVMTQEGFMQNQRVFDHLKARFSWGELGNNSVPHTTVISSVSSGGEYSTMFGDRIAQGANITYMGPKNLKWEKTTEYDFAIEGISLDHRLSYEVDFYYKKTQDAIFPVTTNSVLGASNSTYLDNNADLLNKGVEVSLGWNDRIGDFNYRINGNFAFNHNEVAALKEGTIGIYGGYMNAVSSNYTTVGKSIGEFYGRKVLGIFQNQAEIDAYTHEGNKIQPNAQPGDFKYEDIDGNGVINDYDRDFLGSPLPKYTYGLSLGFDYKGFDFTVDIYGQGGNKIYNAKRFRQLGNENYDLDFYKNRWRGEGTSSKYPSAEMSYQDNKIVNSWSIEKGDFFRIRNIQLGYTLPSSITKRVGIEAIRVYANTSNPLTIFSYKGFSPEIARIPEPGEEDVATKQGIDTNVYPMSAVYNFGININF